MTMTETKTSLDIAREMTERFTHLDDADLQLLAGILVRKEVKRGEIIIPELRSTRQMLSVLKARVNVMNGS